MQCIAINNMFKCFHTPLKTLEKSGHLSTCPSQLSQEGADIKSEIIELMYINLTLTLKTWFSIEFHGQ